MKAHLKRLIRSLLYLIPYFRKLHEAYNSCPWPPGHFYSTIPSLEEIEERKLRIFGNKTIHEICLRPHRQLLLAERLKPYYDTIPFEFDENRTSDLRYNPKDAFYRYSDVVFLHCIMRHFKPRRIIEVGSGHSSAVMLDTNDLYFDNQIHMDFIEPHPEERLNKVLRAKDRRQSKVHRKIVQDIAADFFSTLQKNDILFIDSTHVSKVGSDVNYLFFEVLPVLKPGVLIHVHDIFYPFELPSRWVLEKKFFWNEIYLLRAFLMNNHDYEVVLFNSMIQNHYRDWFAEHMSMCLKGSEDTGSIWLRKIR